MECGACVLHKPRRHICALLALFLLFFGVWRHEQGMACFSLFKAAKQIFSRVKEAKWERERELREREEDGEESVLFFFC